MLAHRRLAVIDTSSAADQPMHDETDTVHVVFNGAIYNFRELRSELIAAGYRFRSTGDTEVIVHGYRAWGTRLFARLTGMFAIVIWDSRRTRWSPPATASAKSRSTTPSVPMRFVFASEIKAILSWPGMPRQPNLEALHDYLSFSYMIGDATAFAGVYRLPPAHVMVCEQGKPARMEAYWQLPPPGDAPLLSNVEDLKAELIERLRAAVQMCLVADVPVGAFLSGGVDSSAVVAMIAPTHKAGLKTFSSGFGIQDYDETRFAETVAERYGTDHHAFTFGEGIIGSAAELAWYYGEPFADSSALVTHALSRETRRRVTVALTGDGADETLLGYGRYLRYGAMRRRRPPEGGRQAAGPLRRRKSCPAAASLGRRRLRLPHGDLSREPQAGGLRPRHAPPPRPLLVRPARAACRGRRHAGRPGRPHRPCDLPAGRSPGESRHSRDGAWPRDARALPEPRARRMGVAHPGRHGRSGTTRARRCSRRRSSPSCRANACTGPRSAFACRSRS